MGWWGRAPPLPSCKAGLVTDRLLTLIQATCEIPVSFEVEVKWTKYGSLVNPQAKIESLTVIVTTAALPKVGGGLLGKGGEGWGEMEEHWELIFNFSALIL